MKSKGGERRNTRYSLLKLVQLKSIDGLVALKIIKHSHEEGAGGTDLMQGGLLGLVVDNRHEITNCFPFPKQGEDEDCDAVNLRHVNVDHLHVGWYQSTYFGSFINRALLSAFYRRICSYRLTPEMMKFYKENDFTLENMTKHNINFETMFQEIPVVLRNSHLVNALLCDLSEKTRKEKKFSPLDLGTSSCVDDVATDTNKYLNFQRNNFKQQQMKQQYLQRGEPPLPEEDINKLFKPLPTPQRLNCTLVCEFAASSLGKLFMAETLHTAEVFFLVQEVGV
ncbi:unnamed protein product [Candidula unifasciata]|uniref:Eukaryotic translation initiation factor 3 subunit H n=1 Tax=Candidula unifasciata TaxID=100452 RepID=A0A8S3ZSU6_9EUPU|nr:unnamed protein product [Candidula unifasciata]